MIERLLKAIDQTTAQVATLAKAAEQLSTEEQNELAARIEALANELRWEHPLNDTSRADALDALADQALAELASGGTRSLDDVLADKPQ